MEIDAGAAMKSVLFFLFLLALGGAGAIAFGGVRMVVTAPMYEPGLMPGTLIVAGSPTLNLVDSPQAVCARRGKEGDEWCAAGTLAGILTESTVLLRLPYSEFLYRLSGAR